MAWFSLLDFKVLLLEKPGGAPKASFNENKGERAEQPNCPLCSLDARSEGQSGHPAEERIRENDRTECSANEPGGIAQFGKVECPHLFL
jgi:hypothetical protein